jgi:8-amino-7-oxononanoate synthase
MIQKGKKNSTGAKPLSTRPKALKGVVSVVIPVEPGGSVAAALEALRVLKSEPQHLRQLRANREALAKGLDALGWDLGSSETPILPLVLGGPHEAVALQERLWNAGFYAPAVRPPTVAPNACRLRVSVSAAHRLDQIDRFLHALGSRP